MILKDLPERIRKVYTKDQERGRNMGTDTCKDEHRRIRAEISLSALDRNLEVMSRHLTSGTRICAVVKADAYGHGSVPLARHMESDPLVWGYAVASFGEAMELREGGIRKPVILLGYVFPEHYQELIRNDVRLCVFDEETAEEVSKASKACGSEARIHIAVDTGMSRIGFEPDERSVETVVSMLKKEGLVAEGLFTHFARADEPSLEPAYEQRERFLSFTDMLLARGIGVPYVHMSNSAAIMRFPASHGSLVRAGITLYGMWPSEDVREEMEGLEPVMRLVSHVSYVKTLPAGRAVSYGGTYITDHDTEIATIPAGYADGYPRMLSGRGEVLIHGKRAPIIGRICMDQFMVDVSGISGTSRGDEVVLFGKQGDEEIRPEEIGRLSGRFNYELTSCITGRVPRVYL